MLVTESVTMVVPGWERRTTAACSAMYRLLLISRPLESTMADLRGPAGRAAVKRCSQHSQRPSQCEGPYRLRMHRTSNRSSSGGSSTACCQGWTDPPTHGRYGRCCNPPLTLRLRSQAQDCGDVDVAHVLSFRRWVPNTVAKPSQSGRVRRSSEGRIVQPCMLHTCPHSEGPMEGTRTTPATIEHDHSESGPLFLSGIGPRIANQPSGYAAMNSKVSPRCPVQSPISNDV